MSKASISKHRIAAVNLLVSAAVSLMVNFSYFVFALVSNTSGAANMPTPLHRVYPGHTPENTMTQIVSRGSLITENAWIQFIWYFLMALILISIATYSFRNARKASSGFTIKLVCCIAVAFILYFLTPFVNRQGELALTLSAQRLINPMIILKSSFTLIVAVLYGKIFELLYQKQNMEIENQELRNENLQANYSMLVNQINPHFFFNSLNSLSMLVRERHNDKALEYIDRLSDTFRYIIQNGQNGITTLSSELDFIEAYKYLLEIRYADKLFFDINVDPKYDQWKIPSLSLLPLVENAVKHNSITSAKPLRINITTERNQLAISNRIISKLEKEEGNGIGLTNLSKRYVLLTGRNISVENANDEFTVKLPLLQP